MSCQRRPGTPSPISGSSCESSVSDTRKTRPGLLPYGWDWKDDQLVENAKEHPVLCEIQQLNKDGKGCKSIAAELNRKGVPQRLEVSGGRPASRIF